MRENVKREEESLPPGWVWTTLGDIAELVGGGTPSRTIPEFFAGDIVWLTPTEIPKDRISAVSDSKERITAEGLQKSSARLVPEGTVLMTSRASIGFVAIAGTTLATNQGFANFICEEGVYNLYLAYWLWANADFFEQQATGTTFKEIIKSKLRTFAFPLAPLPEQHRIVAQIEELFSDLDAGVAALKRVQANLKRYRASVLKAACEGRLVPTEAELAREEGRAYEPADVLLRRILAERRARWEAEHPGKKYVEPAVPETDGLPALPEGWCWASFDQLLCELKNGFFGGRPNTEPPGKPLLRVSAVRPMSVSFDDLRYLADVDGRTEAQYRLQEGDLLFTRYNGSLNLVGACGLVRRVEADALYPDKLIRARVVATEVLPSYLEVFFNTDIARRFIERNAKTTAGQYGIAGGELRRSVIALPPFVEQRRIVAEVERRLSVVAELEATVAANLARAGRLRQAALKRAFEGQLVAQDPSDEPAEALLAGIRAARATVGATRRSPLRTAGRDMGAAGQSPLHTMNQLPLPGMSP